MTVCNAMRHFRLPLPTQAITQSTESLILTIFVPLTMSQETDRGKRTQFRQKGVHRKPTQGLWYVPHLEIRIELNGDAAEGVRLALRLPLVLPDDVLESDLLQLVHLAHAVDRAQQQLVDVAPVQQGRHLEAAVVQHGVDLRYDSAAVQGEEVEPLAQVVGADVSQAQDPGQEVVHHLAPGQLVVSPGAEGPRQRRWLF